MTTIFEKIISREIAAEIIYEDELVLAFLDIKPINPGHTLVIPKLPFADVFSADTITLGHMMQIGQKVALALKAAVACDGVNLIMNNGAAAGQEVFHAHLHVIPRYEHDGAFEPVNRKMYADNEAQHIQILLSNHLSHT